MRQFTVAPLTAARKFDVFVSCITYEAGRCIVQIHTDTEAIQKRRIRHGLWPLSVQTFIVYDGFFEMTKT